MKSLNLFYSGGSGGFLLLHLLLLSGKFYTSFKSDKSLDDIIDYQWNVSDHNRWKSTEIWPDNQQTKKDSTNLCKIYYWCNPIDFVSKIRPGLGLVLYTDINSQFELAFYKKAHWFLGVKSKSKSKSLVTTLFKLALNSWTIHYNNLKDPSWPKCLSFRHINRLPEKIQQELLENQHTHKFLNFEPQLSWLIDELQWLPTENFKNDLVDVSILSFLNSADYVVKLQDIVNSNGKVLEKLLELPPINNKQLDLIKHWKSLHPPELLEKIGIAT